MDSTRSLSTSDNHLTHNKTPLKMMVSPVLSQQAGLWDGQPSPKATHIRVFKLSPNSEDPWCMFINFTQHWTEWRIRKVEPGGQGAKLGIKSNWYLVGLNGVRMSAKSSQEIQKTLLAGSGCVMH
eukprot:UN27560